MCVAKSAGFGLFTEASVAPYIRGWSGHIGDLCFALCSLSCAIAFFMMSAVFDIVRIPAREILSRTLYSVFEILWLRLG